MPVIQASAVLKSLCRGTACRARKPFTGEHEVRPYGREPASLKANRPSLSCGDQFKVRKTNIEVVKISLLF